MSYYKRYVTSSDRNLQPDNTNFIKSLEDQIQDHLNTISKFQKIMDDQSFTINRLDNELNYYKTVDKNNQSKWNANAEKLENQISTQSEMLNRQNDNLQKLNRENFELKSEKIAIQNDLNNFMQASKSLKMGNLTDADLIENLKYEIKCDQKDISELRRELDKSKKANIELECELTNRENQIKLLKSEASLLKSAAQKPEKKTQLSNFEQSERSQHDDFYIYEEPEMNPMDLENKSLKREIERLETELLASKHKDSVIESKTEHAKQTGDDSKESENEQKEAKKVEESLKRVLKKSQFKTSGDLLLFVEGVIEKNDDFNNIEYFQGTIKNNQKSGYCVEIDNSGEKYSGMYETGVREGMGKLTTKEFEFYGQFNNGKFDKENGFLKEFLNEKSIEVWNSIQYVGEVLHDVAHGKGVLKFDNGIQIHVRFNNGKLDIGFQSILIENGVNKRVNILSLPEMNIIIFSTTNDAEKWILNQKTGSLQRS